MNTDLIKLLGPVPVFFAWFFFCRRYTDKDLRFSALLFVSCFSFSQNFAFYYREIHQLIQVCLIFFGLDYLLRMREIARFNIIFFVFLFFVTLSLLFSGMDSDAKTQVINLLAMFGVTNFLYSAIRSKINFQIIICFIGVISLIISVLGVLEFILYGGRIEVTFANPNYLAFSIGIGFCGIYTEFNGLTRKISLLIVMAAILFSGSRAALVIPVLMILWHVFSVKGTIAMVKSLIFIGFSVAMISNLSLRASDVGSYEGSDAERMVFAKIAFRMAQENPVFGVGWGRFISEFSNYNSNVEDIYLTDGVINASSQDRRVTHNDYLRILAELGWPAFLSMLSLIVFGFKKIIINRDSDLMVIFPIWVGTLFFSLTHNNMNSAVFWFVFMMPFFLYRLSYDDV